MSLTINALTRIYNNNYNNFVNSSANLNNNSNSSAIGAYNKTNNYNNTSNMFKIGSSFNETYSKKLNELQTYTNKSKEFYSNFVSSFSELKKSSNALKSYSSTSVFKADGYGSSDSKVVSVKKTGSYDTNKYKVEVNQLATGKSILYNGVTSTGKELAVHGTVSINNGKNSYNFDVGTEKALNNKDAMKKIVEKVNKAGIGVTAAVEEKDGKSSLKFQSATTGENSKLTVNFDDDLSKQMTVKSTEEGKNAKYKVNDVDYSSESNNVNLSSTVKASLNNVGKVEVSSENIDNDRIVQAAKNFANDYNKVVNFLDENSDKSTKIESLANSFGETKNNSSSLSTIGIKVDSEGRLSVDEGALRTAISNNFKNVKDILGSTSGTATEAYYKVQDAMNNSKNLYPSFQFNTGDSPIYTYKNANVLYSQYSALYSGGAFLNSLI